MVNVGKLSVSRLNYSFVVNDDKIYIIGGYDEYKGKFIKMIEVVTVEEMKGSTVSVN
jgi:hypothetical protein